MKIYAARVGALSEESDRRLFGLLDRKRQEKVRALKHKEEQLRSIYAGLLLRHAFLREGYGKDAWERVQIGEGSHGKPYLSNCEGFFYSLSHSGDWALCAVDSMETGADIQKIGALKLAVAKRFYAEEEYNRLLNYESDQNRQAAELYRMWAAKESCAKLTGNGLGGGIDRYVTDSSYTHMEDRQQDSRFFIRLYEQIPGYIVCVCSPRERFPKQIIMADVMNFK